jgi:transcriptional regulator with XRE-family HTH domain
MDKKQLKEMASRIKARRLDLEYTQEEFSEIIGISVSSYTKIENAFQKPSLDTVMKIAQKMNISIDYILFGTESQKPPKISDSEKLDSLLEFLDDEKLRYISDLTNQLAKIKVTSI